MIESFETEWKLLHQGAESKVWSGEILNRNVIKKERFEKTYRNKSLDKKLTKERTRAELRSLIKLKESNVSFSNLLPTIYFVDNRQIIMGEINHAQTINEFNKDNTFENSRWLYVELGKIIAEMHKAGVIHGDMTTSNFLICKNHQIVPIDFGLSQMNGTIEDIAVDLYVLERSLLTNDYDHYEGFEIILDSYQKAMGERVKEVIDRLNEVRLRGRKRNMVG